MLLHLGLMVLVVVAFFRIDVATRHASEVVRESEGQPARVVASSTSLARLGATPALNVFSVVEGAGLPSVFVAIARCESSLDAGAVHLNADGSRDHGLWQINDRWWAPLFVGVDPYDPVVNAEMAAAVYAEQGLEAWAPSRSCWEAAGSAGLKAGR